MARDFGMASSAPSNDINRLPSTSRLQHRQNVKKNNCEQRSDVYINYIYTDVQAGANNADSCCRHQPREKVLKLLDIETAGAHGVSQLIFAEVVVCQAVREERSGRGQVPVRSGGAPDAATAVSVVPANAAGVNLHAWTIARQNGATRCSLNDWQSMKQRTHSVNSASMSPSICGSSSLLGTTGRGLSGKYCLLRKVKSKLKE